MEVVHYDAQVEWKYTTLALKLLTFLHIIRYDNFLNGYSLIPSWRRDRPNEAQQPV